MKKTRSKKSCDTVPLRCLIWKLKEKLITDDEFTDRCICHLLFEFHRREGWKAVQFFSFSNSEPFSVISCHLIVPARLYVI